MDLCACARGADGPRLASLGGLARGFIVDKQTLTVPEAAAALGIHPITLYKLLKIHGIAIRHARIGRRILIPHQALAEFLAAAKVSGRRPGRPKKGGGK